MKGLKIEFEGTDGAGKTTALKYFVQRAKERGLTVAETREVGNPNLPSCVKLREFVLDPANNLRGETMELIFAAMRFENDLWQENLRNSKDCPNLIVSDRGWLSHLAYTDWNVDQQFTDDFYMNFVWNYTDTPDIVVYFKVDTDTALQRRVKRSETMDVIEQKGVEYQELVRESFEDYLAMAEEDGIEVFEVDANQSLESVRKEMDELIDLLLENQDRI